jgi:hypothetical protein
LQCDVGCLNAVMIRQPLSGDFNVGTGAGVTSVKAFGLRALPAAVSKIWASAQAAMCSRPATTGTEAATTLSRRKSSFRTGSVVGASAGNAAECSQGMFTRTAHPDLGRCPTGEDAHDPSASGNYAIGFIRPDIEGTNQTDWFFCSKCTGMFFGGNATPDGSDGLGHCPAGGTHDLNLALSGNYNLVSGPTVYPVRPPHLLTWQSFASPLQDDCDVIDSNDGRRSRVSTPELVCV